MNGVKTVIIWEHWVKVGTDDSPATTCSSNSHASLTSYIRKLIVINVFSLVDAFVFLSLLFFLLYLLNLILLPNVLLFLFVLSRTIDCGTDTWRWRWLFLLSFLFFLRFSIFLGFPVSILVDKTHVAKWNAFSMLFLQQILSRCLVFKRT